MEDLEKLYSPSKWSKRMSGEEVLTNHVEFLNKNSQKVRSQIACELNIAYGEGSREKYDILGTDLPKESPIVLYIHGGYYQEESLTHENCHFIAKNLYKNGIKTITVGYELCPNTTVPEILQSLEKVLKICVEYAKECHSRAFFLAGHSVGAHAIATIFSQLCDSFATADRQIIKAAFLIGGIYNLVPITKMSANETMKLTEKAAQNLSPLLKNDLKNSNTNTKFVVVVGEFDSPAFVQQSKDFFEKLQKDGVNTEYVFIKDVDHFNIIENLFDPDFELMKTILKIIKQN